MTTSTEAQLKTLLKFKALHSHSSNDQKLLSYKILGGKIVKERPNGFKTTVDKAKRNVVSAGVNTSNYREDELVII